MTHTTIIRYRGMVWRLTRCISAIMTCLTRGRDMTVIEDNCQKAVHHVAQMTRIFRRNMSVWLTRGNNTVVASLAIGGNPGVIVTTVFIE